MRKQRVKWIRHELMRLREAAGLTVALPQTHEMKTAKKVYRRTGTVQAFPVAGPRYANDVKMPVYANRVGQQRRANRAARRERERAARKAA